MARKARTSYDPDDDFDNSFERKDFSNGAGPAPSAPTNPRERRAAG